MSGVLEMANSHRLIERWAERDPARLAILRGEEGLSFGELNARANRLARHLQALGGGPETLVGLCVDRSIEIAVGVLAVLKAGAGWLPLDPTYPAERLRFVLDHARPQILIGPAARLSNLPASQARAVYLDADSGRIASRPGGNLESDSLPENMAYVIYTSGSTGQPKGVVITHGNLAHYVESMAEATGVEAGARYLHTASISFSSSVRQLMLPLTQGAAVVVATREQARDPLELFAEIQRQRVTVIDLVPSHWKSAIRALASLPADRRKALLTNALDTILLASEPLFSDLPETWTFDFEHPARLVNMFGQTETTGIVTTYEIPRVRRPGPPRIVPIGRPIRGTGVRVLDEQFRPAPPGTPGEITVAGGGVGRGYLHDPAKTAESFVPEPTGGGRLYRTGDFAVLAPDGELEFLGRRDTQVKIRGQRIELSEVEAAVAAHPGVIEAAVAAREGDGGEKRLVAYVAAGEKPSPVLRSLRARLREKLPEHMIPAAFVPVKELPRLPNGKVNRPALPAPDASRPDLTSPFVPPASATEKTVAGIWSQLLGVSQVGADDDFFELGGHSLVAIRMVSRLRAAFHVDLPVRVLFEAPTIARIADRLDEIRAAGDNEPPLAAVSRPREFPLSFAQESLWLLDQLQPGATPYTVSRIVELDGPLREGSVRRALGEIVSRQEALRTVFPSPGGKPVQAVLSDPGVRLEFLDVSNMEAEAREAQVLARMRRQADLPFDLAAGPLLRVDLIRDSDSKHFLLVTMHHIISDGWSADVFVRELAALLGDSGQGSPAPLLGLQIQYPDFALWQRQRLTGEALEGQLSYWRGRLEGLAVLELPTDRARPPVSTFRGARKRVVLSRTLLQDLKQLSQREGVTLFMTLLAAFQALLSRYSGQEEIVVGSPIDGRNRVELEGLIGFFVNTLVLRTDLSGNPSFRDLLARVREVAVGAYSHQDVPFEKLVGYLKPERHRNRNPLFQVMFDLRHEEVIPPPTPELSLRLRTTEKQTSAVDLTLFLTDSSEGLVAICEYSTDLFEGSTISRLLGHFERLLEGVAADPDGRIATLSILTERERKQLLVGWNQTAADFPPAKTVAGLFEAQAERAPDAVAVEFEGQRLTYGELNRQSNRLARHLRRLGIGPDVLVGLCVERSLEMVVALFGILKAGGAYLPLDPHSPEQRLALMLDDSRPALVVTEGPAASRLPAGVTTVLLDRQRSEIAGLDSGTVAEEAQPENLAYVLYTSGSSGTPKGVAVPHRAVVNFLAAMRERPGMSSADTLLAVTTLSFDIAGLELYLPLTVGARLVLTSREVATSGPRLAAALERSCATVMQATPATWRMLIEAGWGGAPSLTVLCGGEALSRDLATALLSRARRVWNLYGPTETTVWSTVHEVSQGSGPVSIGRPIANTRLYILDPNGQPVPVGVPGELYIGGAGVARGYLNRPELTAEKFVADPFSGDPDARLYRTGDRARYRADGTVEYTGRLDAQVKVRGFRVEPGEIEVALGTHPGVREAAVVLCESAGGDRLVAYLVLDPGAPPAPGDLRAFLKKILPDPMIPAAFVPLKSLPLTPSGKLDRRALPVPDWSGLRSEEDSRPPGTVVEKALADIWSEALSVREIGVEDNFFQVGGDSILATRILSRVRDTFGVELSLMSVFETSTIEEMANAIEAARRGAPAAAVSSIQPVPR